MTITLIKFQSALVCHWERSRRSRKVVYSARQQSLQILADAFSVVGAYILSTLEEGSRDVQQNYGFMVHYNSTDETTRVTSYSIRNKASGSDSMPNSPMSDRFPSSGSPPETAGLLSRALSSSGSEGTQSESFVAFKALPIDPARARRTTGSFEESTDSLPFVKTCKEAVDVITEAIRQACSEIGSAGEGFVVEEDIVG
jgi:hypothetical protein